MIDFVIAQWGKSVSYISTNTQPPIYPDRKLLDIQSAIIDINRKYQDYKYTFDGIDPVFDMHARKFEAKDRIYKNKVIHYIETQEKQIKVKTYDR